MNNVEAVKIEKPRTISFALENLHERISELNSCIEGHAERIDSALQVSLELESSARNETPTEFGTNSNFLNSVLEAEIRISSLITKLNSITVRVQL